ncbi:MAG: hypothetical protein NVS2B17_24810 [Candidatus Velthaea sp.]
MIRKALVFSLSLAFVGVFVASPGSAHVGQSGPNDRITSVEQQTFDSVDGLHDENMPADILVATDGVQNNDAHLGQDEEDNVSDGDRDQSGEQGDYDDDNNDGESGQGQHGGGDHVNGQNDDD